MSNQEMNTFHAFATAVHKRYMELAQHELFRVSDADAVWAAYLAAFPEGTNPIYRTNTEHDCSCCRNFVKNLGSVVAIIDGKVQTVWDCQGLTGTYATVAEAMNLFVANQPILGLFRTKERQYGAEKSHEGLEDGSVKVWHHFWGRVQPKHLTATPDKAIGDHRTAAAVFRRGLDEIFVQDLNEVLELIDSKALYRGEEHRQAVFEFLNAKRLYSKLTPIQRDLFVLVNANERAARFRNTAIGSLLVDMAEGNGTEAAVRAFEQKVAPANYKRPTSLITPRMIENAMSTIESLGLRSALERRHATIADVSINNVLWVDGTVKPLMKDSLIDSLMAVAAAPHRRSAKLVEGAIEIGIEDFMANVLPTASSMELLVQNQHQANFVTITAPVHADAGRLFKWDNGFAWSYDGNVTDSIREKVKKAGGNVSAKLRFSLAWFNHDDLDFHCDAPGYGEINYYSKKGILDVDMNAGYNQSRQPVENLAFQQPHDGTYKVWVNQYRRRETDDVGFTIEIADAKSVKHLSYPYSVTGYVQVGMFTVKDGVIVDYQYGEQIVASDVSQEKWGVKTEQLAKVQTVMLSPNHWDGQAVGNKHYFFLLEGCKADEQARGIYNEFLTGNLEEHRKVFEVLGNKTKCQLADQQLSGLGFSSTRNDTATVVVTTAKGTLRYNIKF